MDSPDDTQTRLLDAFEASGLLVALFDPQDVLRHANRAYLSTFLPGLSLPMPFADVLRHGHRERIGVRIDSGDVEGFLVDILKRRRSQPHRSVTTDLQDGRWILFTETLQPDGWLLTLGTDISALKQTEANISRLHDEAVQASQTDALTGLSSRAHVLMLAAAALEWSGNGSPEGTAPPLSLALIDLDHFKAINDQYGHLEGDRVLKAFADVCRQNVRPDDAIGRLGGEEFLIVFRGLTAADSAAVIQRLRQELAASWGTGPDAAHRVTFSCGIAQVRPGEHLDDLLQRADVALYAAKRGGRDRSVCSG
ncbi:GGDEF domain-containing protein [Leptothrix sp. BB-3]